ncbi:MAG: hypothetical protein Q9194_006038 [Teloschistes cf. exilis]
MSRDLEDSLYPVPIDSIRRKEYPLLNSQYLQPYHRNKADEPSSETTYLDHAGCPPYPQSLMKAYHQFMKHNLLGNPHSQSPSSLLSTQCIESARHRMLRFFRADPEHFDLIFVANATAAIKLVAEGLSGRASDNGFWYGYHADAHTSLVGLRKLASAGSRCFTADIQVDEWLERGADIPGHERNDGGSSSVGVFAYPAQSNLNGRRLPLHWPGRLRRSVSKARQEMYSLLDAAAYVSSAQLDLSDSANAPDFVALSFYKIFGFPNLGALIVRKEAGHILLNRSYFGGGTVDMVINGTAGEWHATKQSALHEALEDGTPAFHSIAALDHALNVHTKIYGSMSNVSQHAGCLTYALYRQMASLTHGNGVPVCEIYKGDGADYESPRTQGPTIAFNIRDSHHKWIGKSDFERLAMINGIQLRTGGVCNPGGIANYLGLSAVEMRQNFAEGLRCGNEFDVMNNKPTGVIRVSLGASSNPKDVDHFMKFIELFVEKERMRNGKALPVNRPKYPRMLSWKKESRADCHHAPRAALQKLQGPNENTKAYLVQASTLNVQCPVVECWTAFPLQEQLWKHFESHKLPSPSRWKLSCF